MEENKSNSKKIKNLTKTVRIAEKDTEKEKINEKVDENEKKEDDEEERINVEAIKRHTKISSKKPGKNSQKVTKDGNKRASYLQDNNEEVFEVISNINYIYFIFLTLIIIRKL